MGKNEDGREKKRRKEGCRFTTGRKVFHLIFDNSISAGLK